MAKEFQQKMLTNLEIAEFCNQMSMMLHSGISPLEALHLLNEDSRNKDEAALLAKLIEEMEMTGSFYAAAEASNVFPNYALQMLRLGEETGTMDQVIQGLADHYTREENLSDMLRSALIYPSIMLGMMAVVVVVLLTKVMPIFNQVFKQLGQEMTGFSAGLLALGDTLSRYSAVFIALVAALVLLIAFGRKHLPFYRKLQSQLASCRFADGMSIALKSGMTPEQGLDLVAALVVDPEFTKKIAACRIKLDEGADLSTALHQTGIFTGTYARIAAIGEKAGSMDQAMSHISSEYEYAANSRINRLIALLEPTLVIILSLVVGIILFSVMLPLLGIMSGL